MNRQFHEFKLLGDGKCSYPAANFGGVTFGTRYGDISSNLPDSNITLKEFLCACKKCDVVRVNMDLIWAIKELREMFGNPRVDVICGYRCDAYNAYVGGEYDSYHLYGMAADVVIGSVDPYEVYKVAEEMRRDNNMYKALFGGVVLHDGYIHLDVRNDGMHRLLRKDARSE